MTPDEFAKLKAAARSLRLDIGKPYEKGMVEGRREPAVIRDDLGLSYDPKNHADRRCSVCRGNGVVQGRTAVKIRGARDRGSTQTFSHSCVCAKKRYQKSRQKLQAAYMALLLAKD